MRYTKEQISTMLPEIDDQENVEATVLNERIVFVSIIQDSDCSNPCDDDGHGAIRSFSTRHNSHMEAREAREAMRDPDTIPLSYYEHGSCAWMVSGDPLPGVEFQWDGVEFAGLWIPDGSVKDSVPKDAGKPAYKAAKYCDYCERTFANARVRKCPECGDALEPTQIATTTPARRALMEKQAASACETYTSWVNGDCWGYVIQVYGVRKTDDGEVYDDADDYRFDTPIVDDSCWGCVGSEWAEQSTGEALTYCLSQLDTAAV